jgi:hypothetical protein
MYASYANELWTAGIWVPGDGQMAVSEYKANKVCLSIQ